MHDTSFKIAVIIGSTREGRFGDKAGAWIAQELTSFSDAQTDIIDLRDYDMPFFDSPVSPAYKTDPFTHESVERFTQKIAEADAYVVVTPEYNRSTSAVLKNAFDWVYKEWGDKPIAFVSYGTVGGARAVEQLRLMAIELQMAPIREAIHLVGTDYFPVLMGHETSEVLFEKYSERAQSMLSQLMKWTHALKRMRT
jgi:NAD(P)H-dependent FMN reductase